MPLDAPAIALLAKEIHQALPVKIDKIFQPFSDEFIFKGYGQGESFKLLVSLAPQFARFHFFDGERENPSNPAAFCMLLRKHLSGAKLLSCEAVPFERVVKLVFEAYEPLAGLTQKICWLELTGRSSNLILTDPSQIIIDAWKKIATTKANSRELLPGLPYNLPATQNRWQPVTLSREEFTALLANLPCTLTLEKFLTTQWYGLSSLAMREILTPVKLNPDSTCSEALKWGNALYDSFGSWSQTILAKSLAAWGIYDNQGHLVDCSAFPIHHPPVGTKVETLANFNRGVALLYNTKQEKARFQKIKESLHAKIKHQSTKVGNKLQKQKKEAQEATKSDAWQLMGELLITYGHEIAKGSSLVHLPNHYDPHYNEIAIKLNPALSSQANAQVYYKKYQKAKKAQQAIAAQLAKTQAEQNYWESLETLIKNAVTATDLSYIKAELETEKKQPVSPHKKQVKNKKAVLAEPLKFTTPSGHLILVGRNNLQNDYLTFKIAKGSDWWFHTQKIPGSHVILKPTSGVQLDEESIYYACELAVYYSKTRHSTKVPVDYTRRKYVKKPPEAKPGFVIYDHFQTAIITPDPEILNKLGLKNIVGRV